MNLPDSQNANHQYAFKKGYRLALEGKPLNSMPSSIRYNAEMREYFQMGWQQVQEEMALASEYVESPWRNRLAWFFMMIIAGIATAALMVDKMQSQQLSNQKPIPTHRPVPQTDALPKDAQPVIPTFTASQDSEFSNSSSTNTSLSALTKPVPKETQDTSLSLLSEPERTDLTLNKQEFNASLTTDEGLAESLSSQAELPPHPRLSLLVGELTSAVKNRMVTDKLGPIIPKHTRKIYFYTQISGGKNEIIYHRWRYKNQIMATIALKIKGSPYRTWSSKRMSSAWQGQWTVEVLDRDKHPVSQVQFRYVK